MRTNIKLRTLVGVINGELPANTIVGNRKDEFGTFYVAFVATNMESGEFLWDNEKDRISLNWRKSNRQESPAPRAPVPTPNSDESL